MRICETGLVYNRMRSERYRVFFVLLTTLCASVVGETDGNHGEVDKDVEFDVDSVRRQLTADIDYVVNCRQVPGKPCHRSNLRGYEGCWYTTTFWTEGYRTPTFQDEKVKNLPSPAVNRRDLRRPSYNKSRSSAPDPAGRAHDTLRSQRRMRRWYLLPVLIHSRQRRLVLLLSWYSHFLEQSYAPKPCRVQHGLN